MSRIRSIKPDFFLDEDLATVSPLARLLFIGLWTLADRDGLLEDRPARIKAAVFPYEPPAFDVIGLLTELEAGRFIQRYEVDGKACVSIRNFAKHQRPHVKETSFGLPPPPKPGPAPACTEKTRQAPASSRRVLLVVGGGDGDGCGNGLPGDAGPLPLTAYADSHEPPPPESYIHSEVEAATDARGLLPHEPPPAAEPPLVEHLRSDWRELRGGEYGGDRGDDAAMRELLSRGPALEIRRRWRIGIAVPPGKYGRVSKLADLVRLWNDCDAAPSTPPPVRHAVDVGRAEAPSGPCVAGCGAEAWAQTWGHRLCVRCTATLQVQVGSLNRASVSAWVESRRQGQGVAP